jgi:hypothetical protein
MAIKTHPSSARADRPGDGERLPQVHERLVIVERILCQHPRPEQRHGSNQLGRSGDSLERAHDPRARVRLPHREPRVSERGGDAQRRLRIDARQRALHRLADVVLLVA